MPVQRGGRKYNEWWCLEKTKSREWDEIIDRLAAEINIRTIQTLLGHADVRTAMIYTHCVPSKTVKEAKSPLDF